MPSVGTGLLGSCGALAKLDECPPLESIRTSGTKRVPFCAYDLETLVISSSNLAAVERRGVERRACPRFRGPSSRSLWQTVVIDVAPSGDQHRHDLFSGRMVDRLPYSDAHDRTFRDLRRVCPRHWLGLPRQRSCRPYCRPTASRRLPLSRLDPSARHRVRRSGGDHDMARAEGHPHRMELDDERHSHCADDGALRSTRVCERFQHLKEPRLVSGAGTTTFSDT